MTAKQPRRVAIFSTLAFIALMAAGATRASAQSVTYTLNDYFSHCASNCLSFTGPFDQVTVTWMNNKQAQVTFQALNKGGYEYLLWDGGAAAANVNLEGGSFSVSHLAYSNSFGGFSTSSPASFQQASSSTLVDGAGDGFGKFDLLINLPNQGSTQCNSNPGNLNLGPADINCAAATITFNLTLTPGGNNSGWQNAASVFTPNSTGYDVVAGHIIPCQTSVTTPCSPTTEVTEGNAGYAGMVPEPGTLLLLLAGALFWLAIAQRRVLGLRLSGPRSSFWIRTTN